LHGTVHSARVRSILLVEDDNDARRALGDQLALLFPEARVLMTDSGETGLELARRTWPSVVLLDLSLRGMGAFQFTERLRRLASGAGVPIVGLVSESSHDALLHAEGAGFAAFLQKPVEHQPLATIVRPLLDRPPAP
jgi:two-component system cell cycle response regulator DivK